MGKFIKKIVRKWAFCAICTSFRVKNILLRQSTSFGHSATGHPAILLNMQLYNHEQHMMCAGVWGGAGDLHQQAGGPWPGQPRLRALCPGGHRLLSGQRQLVGGEIFLVNVKYFSAGAGATPGPGPEAGDPPAGLSAQQRHRSGGFKHCQVSGGE